MSCKLLADKTICNPWCHWALHHQLDYGEPTSLDLKYLIKWPASVVFNSSPKFLDTVFRWKKQTPKVQLNIQVFLKRICLSLKLGSGTFSFFPLVLNHITYQHTCAQRVHTHTHTGTHILSHIKQKKSSVSLSYMSSIGKPGNEGEAMPTASAESTPETLKGQNDVHRTEASLQLQRRQVLELLAWQWTTSNYKKVFTFIN